MDAGIPELTGIQLNYHGGREPAFRPAFRTRVLRTVERADFSLSILELNGHEQLWIAELSGRADGPEGLFFLDQCSDLLPAGRNLAVIDVSALSFMSGSFADSLLKLARDLCNRQGSMVLAGSGSNSLEPEAETLLANAVRRTSRLYHGLCLQDPFIFNTVVFSHVENDWKLAGERLLEDLRGIMIHLIGDPGPDIAAILPRLTGALGAAGYQRIYLNLECFGGSAENLVQSIQSLVKQGNMPSLYLCRADAGIQSLVQLASLNGLLHALPHYC